MKTDEPDLKAVVAVAMNMCQQVVGRQVAAEEIVGLVRRTLHGEKNLWAASVAGLVTPRETASALVAHLHSWMVQRFDLAWPSEGTEGGEDLISQMEDALFHPSGHSA